jgi:hypothetical protein
MQEVSFLKKHDTRAMWFKKQATCSHLLCDFPMLKIFLPVTHARLNNSFMSCLAGTSMMMEVVGSVKALQMGESGLGSRPCFNTSASFPVQFTNIVRTTCLMIESCLFFAQLACFVVCVFGNWLSMSA